VQQQQQPVLAVAFISPPERCIKEGLPTIKRCDHNSKMLHCSLRHCRARCLLCVKPDILLLCKYTGTVQHSRHWCSQPSSRFAEVTAAAATAAAAAARYHDLLVEGSKHWQLDSSYTAWLQAQPTIAGECFASLYSRYNVHADSGLTWD
jgi:hypothetical protein